MMRGVYVAGFVASVIALLVSEICPRVRKGDAKAGVAIVTTLLLALMWPLWLLALVQEACER